MSDEKDFSVTYDVPIRPYPQQVELRDHFAGLAMQGMLSYHLNKVRGWQTDQLAKLAYEVADAMLEERKRRIEEVVK